MAKYDIYSKDGSAKLNLADEPVHAARITCTQEWMGESYVTASIVSPYPIQWNSGDYVIFQGDKYQIDVLPSIIKQKKPGIGADSFVYDNVRFAGFESELKGCEMRDVVLPSNSNKHYTSMLEWSDFCNNVLDFAERILANLNRFYGVGAWQVIYENGGSPHVVGSGMRPSTIEGSHDIVVKVSNESVFEALEHIYEDFGLNYTVRGRKIVIASKGHNVSKAFSYGKGNGLWKLEQVSDEQHKVITRLRAYGNETNVPIRYYNNINKRCTINAGTSERVEYNDSSDQSRSVFFGFITERGVYNPTVIWNSGIVPHAGVAVFIPGIKSNALFFGIEECPGYKVGHVSLDNVDATVFIASKDGEDGLIFVAERIANGIVSVTDGAYRDLWPKGMILSYNDSFPDNLNVRNLMLPGFGTSDSLDRVIDLAYSGDDKYASLLNALKGLGYDDEQQLKDRFSFSTDPLDPYIQSRNASDFGIKEGSVTFDGSVEDYDDIYPSVKYIGDGCDAIVSASVIEDNGVFDKKNETVPPFYVIVNVGFDPRKYISFGSNSFDVEMMTGFCGGRSFQCDAVYDTNYDGKTKLPNGQYRLKLQRHHDTSLSLYFPYTTSGGAYQIKSGDKFVLTGIDMPDEYVGLTAANALFPAAIKYLLDNDYAMYKYQLSVDEMQMQMWCDEAGVDSVTIHDEIHAGMMLNFSDEDLAIEGGIAIDRLTIKEDEGALPVYEVTLSEDKQWSTLKRLKRQVKYQSFDSGKDDQDIAGEPGISKIVRYWAVGSSEDVKPPIDSFSTEQIKPSSEKPYLWMYEVTTMTDGSTFGGYDEAWIQMIYSLGDPSLYVHLSKTLIAVKKTSSIWAEEGIDSEDSLEYNSQLEIIEAKVMLGTKTLDKILDIQIQEVVGITDVQIQYDEDFMSAVISFVINPDFDISRNTDMKLTFFSEHSATDGYETFITFVPAADGNDGSQGESGMDAIQAIVFSESGNLRVPENGIERIYVRVYRGGIDITDSMINPIFRWRRVSNYPHDDELWNRVHSTEAFNKPYLDLGDPDIERRAQFECDVTFEI